MKQLIFIDNDLEKKAEKERRHVQRTLDMWTNLEGEYLSTMGLKHSVPFMEDGELGKILFNPDNAIVTYSMFTPTHYGSLFQLYDFLETAGKLGLKDHVYIDTATYLGRALEGIHYDNYNFKLICKAINDNIILGFNDYGDGPEDGLYRATIKGTIKGTNRHNYMVEKQMISDLHTILQ